MNVTAEDRLGTAETPTADIPGNQAPKEPAASPERFEALRRAARAATAEGRHDDALRLWAELRTAFPGRAAGFVGAANAARKAGRRDIERQLVVAGVKRFPRNAVLAPAWQRMQLADKAAASAARAQPVLDGLDLSDGPRSALPIIMKPAMQRRALPAVLERALVQLEELIGRYDRAVEVRVAYLTVLRQMRRYAEARDKAEAWLPLFQGARPLALAHVSILEDMEDYDGAFAAALALQARSQPSGELAARIVSIQARRGDLDGAEKRCVDALQVHPANVALLHEWANLPARRGEWELALERWKEANRIVPNNDRLRKGSPVAHLHVMVSQAMADESDSARVFSRFESLGATTGGCEFGMVQRHFGSTGLGLLRWANINPEHLMTGLRNNFAGVGTLENTVLKTLRHSVGLEEYIVSDRNFDFGSHTFIYTKDVPADKMLTQTTRRLAYLRDKLLEELAKAPKIFVYKFPKRVGDDVMRDIFGAMRQHGPVRLLCVHKADDVNPRGSVRRLQDGLFAGYIGHFMTQQAQTPESFDLLAWQAVCAAVHAETNS